jgi:hypothetical protein
MSGFNSVIKWVESLSDQRVQDVAVEAIKKRPEIKELASVATESNHNRVMWNRVALAPVAGFLFWGAVYLPALTTLHFGPTLMSAATAQPQVDELGNVSEPSLVQQVAAPIKLGILMVTMGGIVGTFAFLLTTRKIAHYASDLDSWSGAYLKALHHKMTTLEQRSRENPALLAEYDTACQELCGAVREWYGDKGLPEVRQELSEYAAARVVGARLVPPLFTGAASAVLVLSLSALLPGLSISVSFLLLLVSKVGCHYAEKLMQSDDSLLNDWKQFVSSYERSSGQSFAPGAASDLGIIADVKAAFSPNSVVDSDKGFSEKENQLVAECLTDLQIMAGLK